jgi:hypothetical protein
MSVSDGLTYLRQLEDARRDLVRTQRALARERDRTDMLKDAVMQAAREAMVSAGTGAKTKPPRLSGARGGKPEVSLWHLTDWQGGKRTSTYNSAVMRERVERFVEKAIKIIDIQRSAHPVDEITIMLGGDMCEGIFNFPRQVFEIDSTIFGQFVTVSGLLVDVVKVALANAQWVNVIAEWGNHGRIGTKHNAVPGGDNFDRMIYEMSRQLLTEEEPRLFWAENSGEDIQRVEIGEYRALLMHGDEVGGQGAIVKAANQWRSGAYQVDSVPWPFQDVFVGHYHTHAEWPMASGIGAVYQTGSTESDNTYARDGLASMATPSQRLHFVEPGRGRTTAIYKVYVD